MIGKTMIGRGFKGCVNYVLSKVEAGHGELLEVRGVRDFSKKLIAKDFIQRQAVNPKLTKCVWHTTLSFQDKLTSEEMLTIAKQWMTEMSLIDTQFVVVRHTDTNHHHVHIIANRIDDRGKTVSDRNNWKRSEAVCKKLVTEFQLTPIPDHRNENKINREKLRGRDLLKSDINRLINDIILKSADISDFSNRMTQIGFNCTLRLNPDNSVRGLSFERDGVKIKASDIQKNLSVKGIEEMIRSNIAKQKLNRSIPGQLGR
jgi:hypothetical protein